MANPSKLALIKGWYIHGLLTKEEMIRMRAEELGVNVYTGKKRK